MSQADFIKRAILFEIVHGTQRSVGALYSMAVCGFSPHLNAPVVRINNAIRERWPGKDEGMGALARVKEIGWKVADAGLASCEKRDDG